jgi:hypothetical protein
MKQFKENIRTAVFTNKYVLENMSPIIHVYHFDEDGAWQFAGPEKVEKDEDFRIVSLEEIIKFDNSVLEISDLPLGYEAHRKNKSSSWERTISI